MTWLAACSMLAFSLLFILGFEPSLPFQPTAIGILWASIFLCGYLMSGAGRGQVWCLLVAGPIVYLANLAFASLTDLGYFDSMLATTTILFAGWATNVIDPESRIQLAQPVASTQRAASTQRVDSIQRGRVVGDAVRRPRSRWSIWDLGFLTVVVACFVQSWPRLQTPPMLLVAVFAALLGGLLSSWIACRWVWKDNWSIGNICGLGLTVIAGLALVRVSSPVDLPLMNMIRWALSGPLNVIASQGIVVLAVLAGWRVEEWHRQQPTMLRLVRAEAR